jgi:hypothetical protein
MITFPVKLPSGTETAATPAAESQGTFWLKTSWGLYATMGSIMAGTLGYISIDGLATSIFTVIKVWELTAQARLKEKAPAARFPLLIPVPFHISHLV